jgi:CysZ protein
MTFVVDFLKGFAAHLTGLRFALSNPRFIPLLLIPFTLTILLFIGGIWALGHYADAILAYFWKVDPAASGAATSIFYWIYTHIVKYLLYIVVVAGMYFAFMVVANVLACPLYDKIVDKIRALPRYAPLHASGAPGISLARMIWEEIKKACFVLLLPLPFMFIPVIGAPLSLILAMTLLAWDFLDFSLSKEAPEFKARGSYVVKNAFLLLGFGSLLFVPLLNILLYPFAILGATILYEERLLAGKGGVE